MDYLFATLRIFIDPLFFYRRDPLVATGTIFHLLYLISSLYQSPAKETVILFRVTSAFGDTFLSE